MEEEPEKGIRMQCTNKKCRRKWLYTGSRKFYASCPDCHTSVRIRTGREE